MMLGAGPGGELGQGVPGGVLGGAGCDRGGDGDDDGLHYPGSLMIRSLGRPRLIVRLRAPVRRTV